MTHLALHRMADADVSFYGKCECQPDSRVAGGVSQRAAERQPIVLVPRRAADARVVVERHCQSKDEVQDVIDCQCRQIAVGRRLHGAPCQHGHVHQVTAHSEQHDGWYEDLLDDQPRHGQLTTEIVEVSRRVDDNVDFCCRHRRHPDWSQRCQFSMHTGSIFCPSDAAICSSGVSLCFYHSCRILIPGTRYRHTISLL